MIGRREHRHRSQLSDRFAHQDSGKSRAARKMPGKEPFVTRETPQPRSRATRLECGDLVHEQKRRAMRENVERPRKRRHFNAFNKFAGVSFGDTLYQACSIFPSGPMRNAERSMPM